MGAFRARSPRPRRTSLGSSITLVPISRRGGLRVAWGRGVPACHFEAHGPTGSGQRALVLRVLQPLRELAPDALHRARSAKAGLHVSEPHADSVLAIIARSGSGQPVDPFWSLRNVKQYKSSDPLFPCARRSAHLGELSAASRALTAEPLAPSTEAELRDPLRRPPEVRPHAVRARSLELPPARSCRWPSGATNEHLRILLDDENGTSGRCAGRGPCCHPRRSRRCAAKTGWTWHPRPCHW